MRSKNKKLEGKFFLKEISNEHVAHYVHTRPHAKLTNMKNYCTMHKILSLHWGPDLPRMCWGTQHAKQNPHNWVYCPHRNACVPRLYITYGKKEKQTRVCRINHLSTVSERTCGNLPLRQSTEKASILSCSSSGGLARHTFEVYVKNTLELALSQEVVFSKNLAADSWVQELDIWYQTTYMAKKIQKEKE